MPGALRRSEDGDGCGRQIRVEESRRRNVFALDDLLSFGDQLRERNLCDFPVDKNRHRSTPFFATSSAPL
jgi:hypothetical protein